MDKIKNSIFFRVISIVLIFTFIALDISYAYPPEHNSNASTLSTPSVFQQQPISEAAAGLKSSILSESCVIASISDIGDYFFGRQDENEKALPSEHAEEVVRSGLGKILNPAGVEILNIVPVEYLKRLVPEKLEAALNEIGFNGTLPGEGVVFILYRKDGRKFLVQMARKGTVTAANLPGYEWTVSDKYLVKYIPEYYKGPAEDKAPISPKEGLEDVAEKEAARKLEKMYPPKPESPDMSLEMGKGSPLLKKPAHRYPLLLRISSWSFLSLSIAVAAAVVAYMFPEKLALTEAVLDVAWFIAVLSIGVISICMPMLTLYYLVTGAKNIIYYVWSEVFPKSYLAYFMRRLAHHNVNIRVSAIKRLGRSNSKEAVLALIGQFNYPIVRADASAALINIGTPSIYPLIMLLKNSDSSIRKSAAEALDKLGWAPETEDLNITYLIARQEWEALTKIGATTQRYLIAALSDRDLVVRNSVATILAKIGTKETVQLLIGKIYDNDAGVRKVAIEVLGKIGDVAAVGPLTEQLADPRVRESAAKALIAIGQPAVDSASMTKALIINKWPLYYDPSFINETLINQAVQLLQQFGDFDVILIRDGGPRQILIPAVTHQEEREMGPDHPLGGTWTVLVDVVDVPAHYETVEANVVGMRVEQPRRAPTEASSDHGVLTETGDTTSASAPSQKPDQPHMAKTTRIATSSIKKAVIAAVIALAPMALFAAESSAGQQEVAVSIFSVLKDYAFAHPVITGIVVFGICSIAFFRISSFRKSPAKRQKDIIEEAKRLKDVKPVKRLLNSGSTEFLSSDDLEWIINAIKDGRWFEIKYYPKFAITVPDPDWASDYDGYATPTRIVVGYSFERLDLIKGKPEDEIANLQTKQLRSKPASIAMAESEIEALILALGEMDSPDSMAKKAFLVSTKDPHIAKLIISALGSGSTHVRYYAAEALGIIKDMSAIGPLKRALNDKDSHVRASVARALEKIGWKPVTQEEEIAYLFADRDIGSLVKMGSPAIRPLINALGDSDSYIRASAAEALAQIGSPAVELLTQALGDSNPIIRMVSKTVLEDIAGKRAGQEPENKNQSKPVSGSISSETGRGASDIKKLTTAIVIALAPITIFAAESATAPSGIGLGSSWLAVHPVITALGAVVIFIAAWRVFFPKSFLYRFVPTGTILWMLNGNRHTPGRSQYMQTFINILAYRRSASAVDLLNEILCDASENSLVRQAAARALGKIGHRKALKPLWSALRREDKELARAANSAIEEWALRQKISETSRDDRDHLIAEPGIKEPAYYSPSDKIKKLWDLYDTVIYNIVMEVSKGPDKGRRLSGQEWFSLVKANIPEDFGSIRNALTDIAGLVGQKSPVTQSDVIGAMKQAHRKHSLCGDEVRILLLALGLQTVPGSSDFLDEQDAKESREVPQKDTSSVAAPSQKPDQPHMAKTTRIATSSIKKTVIAAIIALAPMALFAAESSTGQQEVAVSIFAAAKDLAFAHPILAGVMIIITFVAIWRTFFPIKWHLWRLRSSESSRAKSAMALSKIRDAHAIELLIKLLGDDSAYVRSEAAAALIRIDDARFHFMKSYLNVVSGNFEKGPEEGIDRPKIENYYVVLTKEDIEYISKRFEAGRAVQSLFTDYVEHIEKIGEPDYWAPPKNLYVYVVDSPAKLTIKRDESRDVSQKDLSRDVPRKDTPSVAAPSQKPDQPHMAKRSASENVKPSRPELSNVKTSENAPDVKTSIKTTQLFEIVEDACVNNKARLVTTANKVLMALKAEKLLPLDVDIAIINKATSAAEVKQGIERLIAAADKISEDALSADVKAQVAELRSGVGRLETDSIVANIIAMARRAKHENQRLIIGFETGWIPGYDKKGSLEHNAMVSMIREIESLGETLRSLGMDNVSVLHEEGDALAGELLAEAEKTQTNLSNVIVLGSSSALYSDGFAALRSTPEERKAFMAAVDPAELVKYAAEHAVSSQILKIEFMKMLSIALELAAGKEPPQTPIIVSYDKQKRMVIFLPKAEPMDYEILRKLYMGQKSALQAA